MPLFAFEILARDALYAPNITPLEAYEKRWLAQWMIA
jgi:hypothetical protein